jgi:hypothetical protein
MRDVGALVALGAGRQRNVRGEGFALLVEKRQQNYTGREGDKMHLPEKKPEHG